MVFGNRTYGVLLSAPTRRQLERTETKK